MGSLKVGDKIIVTYTNSSIEYIGKIGVIKEIDYTDVEGMPYLVKFKKLSYAIWCNAIPYSSLMAELV